MITWQRRDLHRLPASNLLGAGRRRGGRDIPPFTIG
jgi:hypothetical protein